MWDALHEHRLKSDFFDFLTSTKYRSGGSTALKDMTESVCLEIILSSPEGMVRLSPRLRQDASAEICSKLLFITEELTWSWHLRWLASQNGKLQPKLLCAEIAVVRIRCCVILPVSNTREIRNLLTLPLEFGVWMCLGCVRCFRVQNSQPTGK